jgi:hypothetical protein
MTEYQRALARVSELGGFVEGGNDWAREVKLADTPTTDADLARLGPLRDAEILDLLGTQVYGPGLQHLRDWKSLRTLFLTLSKVDDDGLQYLAEMPWLTTLILDFTPVGDRGLEWVGRITGLQVLNIDGTRCTDAGLRHLESLRHLRTLYFGGSITEVGVARLKTKLPELEV